MRVGTVRALQTLRQGSERKGCRELLAVLTCSGALLAGGGGSARAQELLESTRPVPSPDGKHTVAVEWEIPVATGEAVDFSGRMQVRVADTGGTATRQRQIEAPQVRSVQTPLWLDNRWAAFTYNIQKNFNGMVYLDAADGAALQVEMVAPVRRMGATGRTESELTSLDVIEHSTTGTGLYRNITRGRASVFPLVLKAFPQFDGQPFSRAFLSELRSAIGAYGAWLAGRGVNDLHLETGSETFSPDEKHVALLACVTEDGQPETSGPATALIIVPLESGSAKAALASTRLVRLDSAVQLSCASPPLAEGDPQSNLMMVDFVRYTTRWQDARTVAVDREITDEEREEIRNEPVFLATLDGETTRLPAADQAPVPAPPAPAGAESEELEEDDETGETTASEKKPSGSRVSERSADRRSRRSPASTPAPQRSSRESRNRIPTVSAPGASAPRCAPPLRLPISPSRFRIF